MAIQMFSCNTIPNEKKLCIRCSLRTLVKLSTSGEMESLRMSDFDSSSNYYTAPDLSHLVPTMHMERESTGTSIMAVEFDGGVVIGADSRTTMGNYVSNRVSDKLTPVTDNVYCCRSGSSADTQAIADIVKYHLNFHKMQMNELPKVKTAASVFQDLCYNYRDQLTAGIICAGWDKSKGGQVYMIPLGGMCERLPFAIGGSGSMYVYGYVDSQYKENMTKEQCLQFTANTLALAMARDGSSGGIIRLAAITKDGVERSTITGNDIPKFWEG